MLVPKCNEVYKEGEKLRKQFTKGEVPMDEYIDNFIKSRT